MTAPAPVQPPTRKQTRLLTRETHTKPRFLLADRKLGTWALALSIAGSWMGPASLFASGQTAYTHGIWGLLLYAVPITLTLILFGHIARHVLRKHPHGYTLTAYIRDAFSKRLQRLYLLQQGSFLIMIVAAGLMGGALLLGAILPLPYTWTTIGIATFSISYLITGGFRATVRTDQLYLIVMFGIIIGLGAWLVSGTDALAVSTTAFHPEDSSAWLAFATFGIAAIIGWAAGPPGEQALWQRSFAARDPEQSTRAFTYAALVFAPCVFILAWLGTVTRGAGLPLIDDNPQLAALTAIDHYLPAIAVWAFVIVVFFGIVSTIDSYINALSTFVGHDFGGSQWKVSRSQLAMISLVAISVAIANIPGMQILYMFLIWSTLRAANFIPTLYIAFCKRMPSEAGMFWGFLIGIVAGLPLFIYGALLGGGPNWQVAGSLVAIGAGGIGTALGTALQAARPPMPVLHHD